MKIRRRTFLTSAMILPIAARTAWAATPGDILVVAQNIDDIVAIDPAQAYEFTSGELVTNIYDRLLQHDAAGPATLAPATAPAANWSPTAAARSCSTTPRIRPPSPPASPPNGRPTRPPRPSPSRFAT